MNGPIPQEVILAARLATKRRVLAVILQAMAEERVDYCTIDARLGLKAGTARRWLIALMDGSTRELDVVSDLCLAMDREMHFGVRKIEWRRPPEVASADEATP